MFHIQLSNPKILLERDSSDEKISEAIETVFPLDTDYAIINWNNLFIPVSYKYDISTIIDDIIYLYEVISEGRKSNVKLTFPSNTFFVDWEIINNSSELILNSKWYTVIGQIEDLLNRNSELKINKNLFLNELKKLLIFVKEVLLKCGYNSSCLNDFFKLENIK